MSGKITVKGLGKLLYEEFDRDNWGSIDPFAFKTLPKSNTDDEMHGIYEVLERVIKRLNNGEGD